jgi:nuclear transport factor 2 (NTF2) superfamily protein
LTPDEDRLQQFALRYTDAWCGQDPARVAEHYAPSGSLRVNDGAPAVGHAAITDVARSFMTAFPDMQVLFDSLRLDGDAVEYHWTLVGTSSGPGGTGARVRIGGFEEWTFGEDGLIAASQGHFDQAEYDRQLEHGFE